MSISNLLRRNAQPSLGVSPMSSGMTTGQQNVEISVQVPMPDGTTKEMTLAIPLDVFKELQEIAEKKGENWAKVFSEALSLRLLYAEVEGSEHDKLLIKRGDKYQELVAL